jgi:hypothetical protein
LAVLSNEKMIGDENNNELYDNLANMRIFNYSGIDYKISEIKGHCSTLKAISLDSVLLDDLEALQNLPQLESVQLFSTKYTKDDWNAVQAALPKCKLSW